MNRIRKNWLLVVVVGVVAVVLSLPCMGIIWDGGFESNEYRVTFLDNTDNPVPGVTLKVVTQAGGTCYFYPVNEFVPDSSPTSDASGQMVFHHAAHSLEFGGRENRNLLGMKSGDTDTPQYTCIFLIGDREVHRIKYSELRRWPATRSLPQVTKPWQSPDWLFRKYTANPENLESMRNELFDCNRDGVMDREERTARGYAERDIERLEFREGRSDHTFTIVEHTFRISQK